MKSKKERTVELDQWKKLQKLLDALIENLEKLNSFEPFDDKEAKEKLAQAHRNSSGTQEENLN